MKLKRVISAAALLLVAAMLCSCEYVDRIKDFLTTEAVTEDLPGETTEEQTREVPSFDYFDPLTHNPVSRNLSGIRPVAIMIKNDKTASPQYGLTEAAVLYEAAVEGGMTRFLAVYSDASLIKDAGPVIDARTYFYSFAANHNAIFVQAGTTKAGSTVQAERGIRAVDAVVGDLAPAFRRDVTLIAQRGSENSILVNGTGLTAQIKALSIQKENNSAFKDTLTLCGYLENKEMENGRYCTSVVIPFSSLLTVSFKYSTLTNSYARSQYDEPHIDAANGQQLRFTNLILIHAEHNIINSANEMNIVESGSGVGYYVYGGSYIPIIWRRTNGETPISLFESDGTTPLVISSGNTYFAVLSNKLSGKITVGVQK